MAENYDQIRTRSPFTTIDGSETITLNQSGVTKGGFLSVLKAWVLENLSIAPSAITGSTTFGQDLLSLEDGEEMKDLLTLPELATTLEMETGTETAERAMSPALIVGAIQHHTAQPVPVSITASETVELAHVGTIRVADAASSIEITLPVIAELVTGKIELINLGVNPVTIVTDLTTLIDSTGEVVDKDVVQYAHVELIYIGNDTWYVREQ